MKENLIEFRAGREACSLKELVAAYFLSSKTQFVDQDHWVAYVSDRRWEDWSKKVRTRAKVVLFSKKVLGSVPLEIVFENKQFLVINKPPGLPTQKTLKSFEDNLYDQVRRHFVIENSFPQGLPYVGLHHRLDRMTSGLVLMTKQRGVNKEVSDLFKNKKIKKEYLAYCQWGNKTPPKKWLQKDKLARSSHKRHRFYFAVTESGDEAISEFEVLTSHKEQWHLIRCLPKTGRTHQLRVQLSHAGFPIIGDWVYGQKKVGQRLMLHARGLNFKLQQQSYSILAEPNWVEPSQT